MIELDYHGLGQGIKECKLKNINSKSFFNKIERILKT